jgi:hypothetical protein
LHIAGVAWDVEYTDLFEEWWQRLSEEQQVALDAMVQVLEQHGPALGPPYSVEVPTLDNRTLRQLRVPFRGELLCVLYLTDDWRDAVVLLAGATGAENVCPPEQVGDAEVIYQSYVELRRRTDH